MARSTSLNQWRTLARQTDDRALESKMRFSHFFIDRPIFAAVISIIVTLVGYISFRALPIAEYPEIAPPTVVVSATFAGASAEVIGQTVASPIEQEINGVDNMIYMVSQSTGNGALSINVVFKSGTNIDEPQVPVQNRVSVALPRLPEEVQRIGVTVRKSSPDLMLVIHLISPDGSLDQQYISNYATVNVRDVITRVDGVGDTLVFGARDYSMRIWLDPAKVQARGLTASDAIAALRAANVQVAAGAITQPPARSPGGFEIAVQTLGRLSSPEQFADIVVATDDDGRVTRIRDIARVELGSQDYTTNAYLDNKVATAIGIYQRPGSNALATAASVLVTMDELAKSFPPGMIYRVVYNTTDFVQQSVDEVIKTLFEAVVLVVIVIILFLQSWRAAIIPIAAIPVSLVGTLFVMTAFGFSLNNLTLFGLVLAIGIVVDDAIVVENVERYLRQGLSPGEAAHTTMDEVGGALIAIALVLCAVFVPAAFIAGISGAFYRQFALTITASTVISATVSLTLSPALAALLLKPHDGVPQTGLWLRLTQPFDAFFAGFNFLFERLSLGYAGLTRRVLRISMLMLAIYGGLIGLAYFQFARTPSGFIPPLDRAYSLRRFSCRPGRRSLAQMRSCERQPTCCSRGPASSMRWRSQVSMGRLSPLRPMRG
jgi:hydrophobe/amphiphile efflux-1 (HAE1) family protein